MAREVEVKFELVSRRGFEQLLKAKGARSHGSVREHNRVYDHPNAGKAIEALNELNLLPRLELPTSESSLKENDCALRLREERKDGQVRFILAFKGPKDAKALEKGVRSRIEQQAEVEDREETHRALSERGFVVGVEYGKTRSNWEHRRALITIDHVDELSDGPSQGWFGEIEADGKKIEALMEELGVKKTQVERRTYPEMVAQALGGR